MAVKTTYDFIDSNRRRTIALVLLFPLVLFTLLSLVVIPFALEPDDDPWHLAGMVLAGVVLFCGIWVVVALYYGDDIIFSQTGARPATLATHKQVYRLVKNVSLTAGLPMPAVYILDDPSLNAFATGRSPETASVCLTTGLIQSLDKAELEGVIAHEMSHIGNRDIRLMLIIVVCIGACSLLGRGLLRVSSTMRGGKKNNGRALVALVGVALMVFGYLFAPLIHLAVSRQREYQADATAALMTRYPEGLIRALEKIKKNPYVTTMRQNEMLASMCLVNPMLNSSVLSALSGLGSTHPPIEKRIAALRKM